MVHRVSIPWFEGAHAPTGTPVVAQIGGKVWAMLESMRESEAMRESVAATLSELVAPDATEEPFAGEFAQSLKEATAAWASAMAPGDARFNFESAEPVTNG